MRSILDIIVAVKEQGNATEEELRLALVACANMLYSVERDLNQLVEAVLEGKPSVKLRAELSRMEKEVRFATKKLTPTAYLGVEYIPGTPENLKLREMAKNVFKKATGQDL